jgi:hypothetical protein
MGKSIAHGVGAIIGLSLVLAACSGATQTSDGHAGTGSSGASGTSDSGGSSGASSGSGGNASVCAAGTRRCDGLNVKECDGAGVKETIAQTCLPSQSCMNGACVGSVCVPNSKFCKDGAVWACDGQGSGTLAEQCAAGLFCRTEADSASCSVQACTPGQAVCDGNVVTTCTSDGSGPASGGVDCSKSKQACYGGQCRDAACNNGEKLCDHGDVYLCAHNGTDSSLLTDCRTGEVCDGSTGSCRAQICDPGKVSCDGTRVQTCNAFGSAWLPGAVDCAADSKICVSGSCKKQVCTANRSFCQDGSIYSCDSAGTTASLSQTCGTNEHCTTYSSGSFAYCQTNSCDPGTKVCSDNMIKVCNSDGTLPSSGTPCGDTQYCEAAQCKERPCTLGTAFCKDGNIYYCDFNGPYLNQTCDTETACKALGSDAMCAPFACSPASSACLGNQIGTCASNGQSLSQVSTDCATASNVCTADLKCAKSATDTLGVAENAEAFPSSQLVGDVVDIYSTRKLTELQMQLVLAGPRELRWIVYELTGQSFVAKIDKIVSAAAGAGFISSGPLSFTLTAGKRYVLGVVVSGGDAIDYYDSVPFPGKVSFGTVLGRVLVYYPGSFDVFNVDANFVSQMKVTTEP